MLFKPEHSDQILRGEKTQVRRVVKDDEIIVLDSHRDDPYGPLYDTVVTRTSRLPLPHQMTPIERIKWQVGRTYAIQPGRGRQGMGRIRITAIRQEALQDISYEDVIAEGMNPLRSDMRTIDQFVELWNDINTRDGTRWSDNPDVWVLCFELVKG